MHTVPPPPPSPRLYVPPPPPPPTPAPHHIYRIIHPMPLANTGQASLDIPHIVLRVGRKCGPAQLGGGHWIHLDCNVHVPIQNAAPAAVLAHKITLMQKGVLRLDQPGLRTAARRRRPPQRRTEGPIKDQGQVGSCTSFSLSSAWTTASAARTRATPCRRCTSGRTTAIPRCRARPAPPSTARSHRGRRGPYDERIACELDQSGEPGDCGPYSPPVTQGAGPTRPQGAGLREGGRRGGHLEDHRVRHLAH